MIMVDTQQNYSSKTTNSDYLDKSVRKKNHTPGAEGDYTFYTNSLNDNKMCTPHTCSVTQIAEIAQTTGIISILKSLRDPIADFQEKRGVPKKETFTFPQLVTAVFQKLYQVVMLVGNMIMNLFPLVDAFLLIIRFLLDKAIECAQATSNDRYVKTGIFVLEFIALFFMILAMLSMIVSPLYVLFGHIFSKIWNALM